MTCVDGTCNGGLCSASQRRPELCARAMEDSAQSRNVVLIALQSMRAEREEEGGWEAEWWEGKGREGMGGKEGEERGRRREGKGKEESVGEGRGGAGQVREREKWREELVRATFQPKHCFFLVFQISAF